MEKKSEYPWFFTPGRPRIPVCLKECILHPKLHLKEVSPDFWLVELPFQPHQLQSPHALLVIGEAGGDWLGSDYTFTPEVKPFLFSGISQILNFQPFNDSISSVAIISSWVLIHHECSHQVAFLGKKPSPITLSLPGWNHFWPWGHPGSQIFRLSAI